MSAETDRMRQQLIAAGVPEIELAKITLNGERIWDTAEMQKDFEPLGFAAPFIVVRRRSDGQRGSLMFTHYPRFYFNFDPSS